MSSAHIPNCGSCPFCLDKRKFGGPKEKKGMHKKAMLKQQGAIRICTQTLHAGLTF